MHKKNMGHLIGHIIYIVLYGLLIISTIFLYNSANILALLYLGCSILVLGFTFLLWSSQARKKGNLQGDINKNFLVESGMYAFVRHPGFLGHMLIISALVIISQNWISLSIGIMLIILLYLAITEEEKRNIEKFGDKYKDYMRRVPRINLLIGFARWLRRKENKEESGT